MKHVKKETGCTLLELLVVTVIIGIIILAAIPGYTRLLNSLKNREQIEKRLQPLSMIQHDSEFDNWYDNWFENPKKTADANELWRLP